MYVKKELIMKEIIKLGVLYALFTYAIILD